MRRLLDDWDAAKDRYLFLHTIKHGIQNADIEHRLVILCCRAASNSLNKCKCSEGGPFLLFKHFRSRSITFALALASSPKCILQSPRE